MKNNFIAFVALILFLNHTVKCQELIKPDSALINTLMFRSIGPALASGRIADIAVNPFNSFEYFVAVASGNIWKTSNNGTTWKPVFDIYGAYSIACIAIDPKNPNVVWAGTGENNSQRALGYGDGVYKSVDGGESWTNMGLKNSRQIGKIIIDPRNPEILFVAAEGSVWGPGGERGLYKTTDGGNTWNLALTISENTGVSDIAIDPQNPDIIYAAAHQRRRHFFTKINGGPESGMYKSIDAGKTWKKINKGLPESHLGAIGIAVSPVNTNTVYAIVEAANDENGFFRSVNQGESWEKMSDYKTTGGQYYNEIFCDPKDVNKVYSMDTYTFVTLDGGKTWQALSNKFRHVDDHALWIDPTNTSHLRIGGDGGLYESFDNGSTWNFTANLPVTQFYRINTDNSEPFYYIYGGTQDNNTLGGPSRNTSNTGVSNDEWFATLGGDGFWIAIDSQDPNTVYCEYQYGNAYRYNKLNGELVYIKPQEPKNELTYKWNWDAPLILSPHSNTRLYMAANKVFMSSDKGNSWQVISSDLTRKIDRNSFKVMGKYWSADAVAKDVSTSQYGTIVSLAESPVKEGLLFAGTDDGAISITEDFGKTWRTLTKFPNIPEYSYVSDVFPSQFDENVIYATFNNHQSDDLKPYVLLSNDKGKTWTNISSNLPLNGPVHCITQDYIQANMLFCGTESGIFISLDNGRVWTAMKNGIPTISVRDISIQKRESDLVVGTFGRGIYILEDYSPLREIQKISSTTRSVIFPVKQAKLYIPRNKRNSYGDSYFTVENPPYGATFNIYLKDSIKTTTEKRLEKEEKLFETGSKIDVISWDDARMEKLEETPYILTIIEDSEGNTIRKIASKSSTGFSKIVWDLKYPTIFPDNTKIDKYDPFKENNGGIYVMPGSYSARMFLSEKGVLKPLTEKVNFNVTALNNTGFNASDRKETLVFQQRVSKLSRSMVNFAWELKESISDLQKLKQENLDQESFDPQLNIKLVNIELSLDSLDLMLNGYLPKASYEEVPPAHVPTFNRLYFVIEAFINSSDPTNNAQIESLEIAELEFKTIKNEFDRLKEQIESLIQ